MKIANVARLRKYPSTLLILCFTVLLGSQAAFGCHLSSPSCLRPAAALERIKRPSPLGSLSDEELIGFTQDAMTLSGDPDELLIFDLALKELERRGWSNKTPVGEPWREIAERDKARIETLIEKSRVGSFASEVAKFKRGIILSSI